MTSTKVQEMLDLAAIDLERLSASTSCDEARLAWTSFLENANRALNRLEGHAKKVGRLPLYRTLIRNLWLNPVAKYVRMARNNHEHSIVDADLDDPHNERITLDRGIVRMSVLLIGVSDTGKKSYMVPAAPMELSSDMEPRRVTLMPTVRMLPIEDKDGVEVWPPVVELKRVDEPEPCAIARHYLGWVEEQVALIGD